MRKTFLFLLVLLFAVVAFAEDKAKVEVKAPRQLTEQEKLIFKIKYKLDSETVLGMLQKYNNDIVLGIKDKKPLSALRYHSDASAIETLWIKYRWFTADTGLNKNWLKKIHKLFLYMNKTKSYMEVATVNGETETPKYKKTVEYLKTAQAKLAKLIKNPVKVPAKMLKKEKKKKIMWQKAMQKKYNKKVLRVKI